MQDNDSATISSQAQEADHLGEEGHHEFLYIGFERKSGLPLAHGKSRQVTRYRSQTSNHMTAETPEFPLGLTVLYCGNAGPYIWAEGLNLDRAKSLISSLIISVKSPKAMADEPLLNVA